MSRAAEVVFYQDYGEKVWKLLREYNKRPAVERTFSVFKQIFGEEIMARNGRISYSNSRINSGS